MPHKICHVTCNSYKNERERGFRQIIRNYNRKGGGCQMTINLYISTFERPLRNIQNVAKLLTLRCSILGLVRFCNSGVLKKWPQSFFRCEVYNHITVICTSYESGSLSTHEPVSQILIYMYIYIYIHIYICTYISIYVHTYNHR